MGNGDLNATAHAALESYTRIFGANLGNVQILRGVGNNGVLEIVAQRGFKQPFLDAFARVTSDDHSACGRALRFRKSIVIPDVDLDEEFAPFRHIAHDAGFRSVISSPIITDSGKIVGVISRISQTLVCPTRMLFFGENYLSDP